MYEIPAERLPPGFLDSITEEPARPATPRPAATTVLLRDGDAGPEVLLMRRHRASGFVPGAWVFPGGRVDAADSGPAFHERVHGLDAAREPHVTFWTAAARELFEETGVLLARAPDGDWVPDAVTSREMDGLRHQLMEGASSLGDVLASLDATLDLAGMVHAAHWITPVVEARRYDTHFFVAALPEERAARPDAREMTDAVWIAPAAALARFRQGTLPMVFPTVKTLELLGEFESVEHALAGLRHRDVPTILPRLVRTPGGVAIVVDP
jgi:8-oxo-dGTP pyrophosphatase MutT (NUDIX family)